MAEKKPLVFYDDTKRVEEMRTGDIAPSAGALGSATKGQSTVPFATFLPEGEVVVTGQTGITASSYIQASVYADNDDVYSQTWDTPIIRNIVVGTGFSIVLRPDIGQFKGNVKVNWIY